MEITPQEDANQNRKAISRSRGPRLHFNHILCREEREIHSNASKGSITKLATVEYQSTVGNGYSLLETITMRGLHHFLPLMSISEPGKTESNFGSHRCPFLTNE